KGFNVVFHCCGVLATERAILLGNNLGSFTCYNFDMSTSTSRALTARTCRSGLIVHGKIPRLPQESNRGTSAEILPRKNPQAPPGIDPGTSGIQIGCAIRYPGLLYFLLKQFFL